MLFPWTDWQFWMVTVIASWGGWTVLRQLLPRQKSSTVCGGCAAGTAACAKHTARDSPAAATEPQLVLLSSRRRG